MKVIEIQGDPDDFLSGQIALVDADGIRKETRLDIVHAPKSPNER